VGASIPLIEHVWNELREKLFHNRVFDSLDALQDQLMLALKTLGKNPETVRTMVSWGWSVSSFTILFMKWKRNNLYKT
jgi:hypothetical protein